DDRGDLLLRALACDERPLRDGDGGADGSSGVRDGVADPLPQPERSVLQARALAAADPRAHRRAGDSHEVAARVPLRRRDLLPRLGAAAEALVDRLPAAAEQSRGCAAASRDALMPEPKNAAGYRVGIVNPITLVGAEVQT